MNGFYWLWLVIGLIFLALIVVAVRSDLTSRRRRRRNEWHADSHRSPAGSNQYGVGSGPEHPGSINAGP
jgi:hypothetical protein